MKNLLFESTGGIWMGKYYVLCFQASIPFGKVEIYDDEVVLRIQNIPHWQIKLFETAGKIFSLYSDLPQEIHLSYEKIKGFKIINLGILGHGIRFIHNDNQYPPLLIMWLWKNQAEQVRKYLESKIPKTAPDFT